MFERRRVPRDPYTAEVTYTLLSQPDKVRKCYGRNICSEGISLHLDVDIKEEDRLSMSFLLNDEAAPISAIGCVVWSQRIDDETVHVGIAFEEISAVDQARIISYIVRNCPHQVQDII